jgi:hypothetical protein
MDPHQEAVLRKIALRLVPLLTLAFVVNYLDRTNIAVAALRTRSASLMCR